MANLRLSMVMLKDKTPGDTEQMGIPAGGWDSTISCSTVAAFQPGTKFAHYTDNTNNPGWYTMLYGCLAEASAVNHCISADVSDGAGWVAHAEMTEDVSDVLGADPTYTSAFWNGVGQPFWVMANCITGGGLGTTDVSGCGQVGLACCSMHDHQYGWFWIGGVCPCKDVSYLDDVSGVWTGADMTAAVVAGNVHLVRSGASVLLTSADFSTTVDDTIPTVSYEPCGYVLTASA